jgi:hypothetical protein
MNNKIFDNIFNETSFSYMLKMDLSFFIVFNLFLFLLIFTCFYLNIKKNKKNEKILNEIIEKNDIKNFKKIKKQIIFSNIFGEICFDLMIVLFFVSLFYYINITSYKNKLNFEKCFNAGLLYDSKTHQCYQPTHQEYLKKYYEVYSKKCNTIIGRVKTLEEKIDDNLVKMKNLILKNQKNTELFKKLKELNQMYSKELIKYKKLENKCQNDLNTIKNYLDTYKVIEETKEFKEKIKESDLDKKVENFIKNNNIQKLKESFKEDVIKNNAKIKAEKELKEIKK